jgi:hypothetical protein
MVDHRPLPQAGFTTLIPAMARNANGEECAIERLNLSKTLERHNLVGTYGPLMTGNDPLRSLGCYRRLAGLCAYRHTHPSSYGTNLRSSQTYAVVSRDGG